MEKAKIYYHDIGDYLSREDKLHIIKEFGSIKNVPWAEILPDEHGDWINHRNDTFGAFIPLGDKDDKRNEQTFFVPYYSNGLKTQRDPWCYNSSLETVKRKAKEQIDFYNEELDKLLAGEIVDVNYDTQKISWTRAVLSDIKRKRKYNIGDAEYRISAYRPFYKQNLLYYRPLNEMMYQIPKLFPTPEYKNLVICVSGIGVTKDFSCIVTNVLPDLELIGKSQCFPLYWYEEETSTFETGGMDNLFGNSYVRHDGVTDWILTAASKLFGSGVTKDDMFYYVYGLLHSPEYRAAFTNDLKKSLPRLPLVENPDDFWAFVRAGRELAALHLDYENIEPYRGCTVTYGAYSNRGGEAINYRVEKMRFGKTDGKTVDKSTIHYNGGITITGIPAEAYEYVINGKSAIEWIMERYAITTDKKSGIINDPNDWPREHGDEKYILNLLLRIVTLSLKTTAIVKSLPTINFE